MKVSDYIKQGLKNRVEEKPNEYQLLGSVKEGVHKIECYIKVDKGKILDAKYSSSKRCKKLMAVADLIYGKIKGQKIENIQIDDDYILQFFKEEKDKDKMKDRINIVKKALNMS